MNPPNIHTSSDDFNLGMLLQRVEYLDKHVAALSADVKALLAMAERSKGAMWAGMSLAAMAGSVASWVVSHWVGR